jgi:hypothetical protein
MSAGRLVALPGGLPDRPASWEQLLRTSVRPEFQVDVYLPGPGDPVLFGPTCAVAGCDARGLQCAEGIRGYFCQAHAVMWRRDGEPPQEEWVRDGARGLRRARPVTACLAVGCRRSAYTSGLCEPHFGHWRRAGRPPLELFVVDAPATRTGIAGCRVPGCAFPAILGKELCDAHHKGFCWLRFHRAGVDLDEGALADRAGARSAAV